MGDSFYALLFSHSFITKQINFVKKVKQRFSYFNGLNHFFQKFIFINHVQTQSYHHQFFGRDNINILPAISVCKIPFLSIYFFSTFNFRAIFEQNSKNYVRINSICTECQYISG